MRKASSLKKSVRAKSHFLTQNYTAQRAIARDFCFLLKIELKVVLGLKYKIQSKFNQKTASQVKSRSKFTLFLWLTIFLSKNPVKFKSKISKNQFLFHSKFSQFRKQNSGLLFLTNENILNKCKFFKVRNLSTFWG